MGFFAMIDIRLIREQPEMVRQRLAARGGDAHLKLEEILGCDRERRGAETRLQQLQGERKRVSKEIGPIAKPDQIRFAEALPKTRSGKIMRRLLKEVAAGGAVKGDVTTLEDLNVIAALQSGSGEEG